MRIILTVAIVTLVSGCASHRFDGKTLTMDYYAGSTGTVMLRSETAARLGAFLATLPRAKHPEPEFTQALWDKPGLPESLRPKEKMAEPSSASAPQTDPKQRKKYTLLDERRLVASISVYDAPDDKWMSSGYLILEEGIRVVSMYTAERHVLELDEHSLSELKKILDSALKEPNKRPEPMAVLRTAMAHH